MLPLKVEAIKTCFKKTNLGPDQTTELATAVLEVSQELRQGRQDRRRTQTLVQSGENICASRPIRRSCGRIVAAQNYLHDLKAELAKINVARQKLTDNPNDADAQLAVGLFECVVHRDWQAAFDHLSKGSDSGLRELAKSELAVPRTVADREKLADGWYDRGKREAAHANQLTMFFRIPRAIGMKVSLAKSPAWSMLQGGKANHADRAKAWRVTFSRDACVRICKRTQASRLNGDYSTPFVLGIPVMRGSASSAMRNARAVALKIASAT